MALLKYFKIQKCGPPFPDHHQQCQSAYLVSFAYVSIFYANVQGLK